VKEKKKKTGIDKEELAFCKRRGHKVSLSGGGWAQCSYCRMWLREVRKIEERSDEPPVKEMSSMEQCRRSLAEAKRISDDTK
jgi:hypothetical protein